MSTTSFVCTIRAFSNDVKKSEKVKSECTKPNTTARAIVKPNYVQIRAVVPRYYYYFYFYPRRSKNPKFEIPIKLARLNEKQIPIIDQSNR